MNIDKFMGQSILDFRCSSKFIVPASIRLAFDSEQQESQAWALNRLQHNIILKENHGLLMYRTRDLKRPEI